MKRLAWLWLLLATPASSEGFLESRCHAPFPETMSHLQELIAEHGYTLSRVQHVDQGLRQRGYQTGDYRVVFFGRPEQMRRVRESYPALMPYLPLSITLYEKADYTGASSLDPLTLQAFFDQPELLRALREWHEDIADMLQALSRCNSG